MKIGKPVEIAGEYRYSKLFLGLQDIKYRYSKLSTGTQSCFWSRRYLISVLKVEYRYSKWFKVQRILSTGTES